MGTMDGGTKGLGCDGMAADFMLSISHLQSISLVLELTC